MDIKQHGHLSTELVEWNNQMYKKHPTPYKGIAGYIEYSRVRSVLMFAQIKSTDAVLELGCESGNLLINVSDAKRIVGGDISQVALNDAARLFENRGRVAEFIHIDAQNPLPFAMGEFDVVICSEMLEHVHNPRVALENMHNISTDETRVVISVPIEAPKIIIKRVLKKMGLLKTLFPGIEEGKSEWHLQNFSRNMFEQVNNNPRKLFKVIKSKVVWGNHYVTLLKKN